MSSGNAALQGVVFPIVAISLLIRPITITPNSILKVCVAQSTVKQIVVGLTPILFSTSTLEVSNSPGAG